MFKHALEINIEMDEGSNTTMNLIFTPLERSPSPHMEITNFTIHKISESCDMTEIDIQMRSLMQPRFITIDEEDEEEGASADYSQCVPRLETPPKCKDINDLVYTLSIPNNKVNNGNHIKVNIIIFIIYYVLLDLYNYYYFNCIIIRCS